MLKGLLQGILFFIGGLVPLTSSADQVFDASKYDVYFGDFNSDGVNGDIYFHGKDILVLIHGDISIPIWADGPDGYVYYQGDGLLLHSLDIGKSQLQNYAKGLLGQDYTLSDLNGDGTLDVTVNAPEGNGWVLTLESGVQPEFSYQNSLPSEFQYDLSDTTFLPPTDSSDFVATTNGDAVVNKGVASYSVQFDLPPTIRNLKPFIGLEYKSSNNHSGIAGVGWNISGLSVISRCKVSISQDGRSSTEKYGDRLCLDGERLNVISAPHPGQPIMTPEGVPLLPDGSGETWHLPDGYVDYWAEGASYRRENNGVDRIDAKESNNYFQLHLKNGNILTYGGQESSQNSRRFKPGTDGSSYDDIIAWALDSVEDRYGNKYTLHYERNDSTSEHYLSYVSLSPNASVVFDYDNRDGSDITWGYVDGYKYQYSKILKSVTTYVDVGDASSPNIGTEVKRYNIDYRSSAKTKRYLVERISECGFKDGVEQCALPLSFNWTEGNLGFGTDFSFESCSGGGASLRQRL